MNLNQMKSDFFNVLKYVKYLKRIQKLKNWKIGLVNDPIFQVHSLANYDHWFHLQIVLFCAILQGTVGRK